jgi:hypothetical protein
MQDVHVPSAPRGGVGSSSHPPTGSRGICTEDDDEDQGHEKIGPSQLDDAPSTHPMQQVGTRRRRPPDPYTPGTHALGHKGKGRSRRQWGTVADMWTIWTVWTIIMDCYILLLCIVWTTMEFMDSRHPRFEDTHIYCLRWMPYIIVDDICLDWIKNRENFAKIFCNMSSHAVHL